MDEPKKLYRIENGKVISGVCGGIAEYFNVDYNLVRIIWAVLACMAGCGILAYLICAIILPKKSDVYPGY